MALVAPAPADPRSLDVRSFNSPAFIRLPPSKPTGETETDRIEKRLRELSLIQLLIRVSSVRSSAPSSGLVTRSAGAAPPVRTRTYINQESSPPSSTVLLVHCTVQQLT